jgi:hypothetical protein
VCDLGQLVDVLVELVLDGLADVLHLVAEALALLLLRLFAGLLLLEPIL